MFNRLSGFCSFLGDLDDGFKGGDFEDGFIGENFEDVFRGGDLLY